MPKKMIASRAFPYGMTAVKDGDTFDAEDHHAEVFEAVGYAKEVPAKRTKQQYQTKVMTAETEAKRDPSPIVTDPAPVTGDEKPAA